MDAPLTALLDELARFGDDNDARETERPRRMLNITPDTGRLLSILVRSAGATRILEVGTSNAYSTIWLADAARETGGSVTTSRVAAERYAASSTSVLWAASAALISLSRPASRRSKK